MLSGHPSSNFSLGTQNPMIPAHLVMNESLSTPTEKVFPFPNPLLGDSLITMCKGQSVFCGVRWGVGVFVIYYSPTILPNSTTGICPSAYTITLPPPMPKQGNKVHCPKGLCS